MKMLVSKKEHWLTVLILLFLVVVCVEQFISYRFNLALWDLLLVSGLAAFALALLMFEQLPRRFAKMRDRVIVRKALVLSVELQKSPLVQFDRLPNRWSYGFASFSAVAMTIAFVAAFFKDYPVSLGNILLTLFWVVGAFVAGLYLGNMAAYGQLGNVILKAGELGARAGDKEPHRAKIGIRVVPDAADGVGGLKPIGDFYLFQASLAAIPSVFLGGWAIVISVSPHYYVWYSSWLLPYLGLLVVTLAFVYFAAIVPIYAFHRLMVRERERLLREQGDPLAAQLAALEKRWGVERLSDGTYDGPEERSLKEILQRRCRVIERCPTWPLDFRPRAQFFGTVLMNVVSLLVGVISILGSG